MRKNLTKFDSFDIEYDQGVPSIAKLNVVGRFLDGEKGPEGLTLRHGINLILTVQKEQIPIVQVYQTTKTLKIRTEIDEPTKSLVFASNQAFVDFVSNF